MQREVSAQAGEGRRDCCPLLIGLHGACRPLTHNPDQPLFAEKCRPHSSTVNGMVRTLY